MSVLIKKKIEYCKQSEMPIPFEIITLLRRKFEMPKIISESIDRRQNVQKAASSIDATRKLWSMVWIR